MTMMPSLVVSAHAEWIMVPTKYRLSNTLYGFAYQVARSGTRGAAAGAGAGPPPRGAPAPPPRGAPVFKLSGATQMRANVPVYSVPAARLAAITRLSGVAGAGACACDANVAAATIAAANSSWILMACPFGCSRAPRPSAG